MRFLAFSVYIHILANHKDILQHLDKKIYEVVLLSL